MLLLKPAASAPVLGAACGQLRCLSAAAQDVVGEMISYARQNFKGAHDQALDIVKSGLSYMNVGPDAGRLYLAQAEIEADRSRWPEVADLARAAATAASEAAPTTHDEGLCIGEVELFASVIGTRAHLVKARSADAFTSAQMCMDVARKSFTHKEHELQRWRGLVRACSVVGLVQHVAFDFEAAAESFEGVVCRADPPAATSSAPVSDPSGPAAGPAGAAGAGAGPAAPSSQPVCEAPPGGQEHARDHLIAPALKQAALFALAQADAVLRPEPDPLAKAQALAARAVAGAERAAEEAKGGAGVFQSPVFCGEAVVDAHLADAQVSMHSQDWDTAEAKLTKALAAAEGISSESNPRVALVLMLLAHVYSRSARVTLAEGLYRECSKMLQISPARADDVDITLVHPSIGALLAWRYCQLLTALPNRGTEAAGWHKLAGSLWEEAPVGRKSAPESVFGGLEFLRGKGGPGLGVVVDLMCRRALPRQP